MELEEKLKLYEQARIKYGVQMQMLMSVEECAELQKEVIKNIRGCNNLAEMAEEIADVEITTEQLKDMWKLENVVASIKERKLNRLKERITNK